MKAKSLQRSKVDRITEYCNNADCKTPKCPYRYNSKKANSDVVPQDLSQSCDYYSIKGDGRYETRR